MPDLHHRLIWLLERYSRARQSANSVVMAYWTKVDGFGTTLKDFDRTTPVEAILRELRRIGEVRPDLLPVKEAPPMGGDLFEALAKTFPGIEKAPLGQEALEAPVAARR